MGAKLSSTAATADLFLDDQALAIERLHRATALYTVDPVVLDLLARAGWPERAGAVAGGTMLDPSSGDGAFLLGALDMLLAHRPKAGLAEIGRRIRGWEIHHVAAEESRAALSRHLQRHGFAADAARATARAMVVTGDFLVDGPTVAVADLIAGNPPYLRMAGVMDPLKSTYRTVLPDRAALDLMHAFLDRCLVNLTAGGEVAFVTSDRWLFNEGTASLREALGERFRIRHLVRLPESSFRRPKSRQKGSPPRVHPVAVVLSELDGAALSARPVYPEAGDTMPELDGPLLGDIAEVRVAPWLGREGRFVLPSAAAADLPARRLVPAVDTDDLSGLAAGDTVTSWTRLAVETRPDDDLEPELVRHLAATDSLRPISKRSRAAHLPPERFDHLDLSREALLVPRIARNLRPIRLPAGLLAINHNITIVGRRLDEWPLDRLIERMTSPEVQAWVAARAPRLENGYLSITTTMLRQLPLGSADLRLNG